MSSIQKVNLIPYARKKSIEFYANNLRPDRDANFFFDDKDVNEFTQVASELVITTQNVSRYITGEGIFCESTNAYATVIKSVSPSTLYLNDNYVTLKVSQYSASTLTSGTFEVGEVVFQTSDNSNVFSSSIFSGKVEYWFSANSSLIISPISGTANTVSTARVLHTVTQSNKANLSSVQSVTKFPVSATIKSTSDATKTAVVSSYSHRHGVVETSSGSFKLSSPYTGTSTAIKITEGSGLGQSRVITSNPPGSTSVVLNTEFDDIDGTSKYSIGPATVDDNGNLAGIFHLPETPTDKFLVGERVFTITDADSVQSTSATMRAFAKYQSAGLTVDIQAAAAARAAESSTTTSSSTSTGQVTVNQETTTTTSTSTGQPAEPPPAPPGPPAPPPAEPDNVANPVFVPDNRFANFVIPNFTFNLGFFNIMGGDPLAQTFFTPRGYGTFITSVDLFFKAKPLVSNEDPQLPVRVLIMTTQNGYPTTRALASATVQCHDVKTSDGVNTFPRATDASTKTNFTFADPVYLAPGSEYALVVFSDSPSYEVWVSELGSKIIGDVDGRRVSEQPYIGSLFKSQNASTWTAIQNEDLMFVMNRAVFNKTPTTLTFGTKKLPTEVPFDEILLNATEIEFPSANIDHKLKTTLYSTNELEPGFRVIDPNKPFWFAGTTDSLGDEGIGRRRVIEKNVNNSLQTQVVIDTDDDTISPFFNSENYGAIVSQNLINNGELYNTNITITNSGFHDNVANVKVDISDSNLYPEVNGAKANAVVILNASGNVESIVLTNAGKGYIQSPTITIGEHGRTDNATAVIVSEDSKYGGNALCRYITRRVTLADGFDSGDLRVTLRAIRPQGTNILVYYKVQSATDSRSFTDINWRRMYLENSNVISPDLSTAIDFKYSPNEDPTTNKLIYEEDGISYPLGGSFKYFAIKIVLLAECGCVAPTVRNLRAIALPEG